MSRKTFRLAFFAAGMLLGLVVGIFFSPSRPAAPQTFDGERAYQDVLYQMALGPRLPGSESHAETRTWILKTLQDNGWQAETVPAQAMGHDLYNLVGKRGEGRPWVILGAHYDNRLRADHDPHPEYRATPVPGANDGASGVAVLLELARTFPQREQPQIWLVFFDGEDNGEIPGWDWILGSRAFAQSLPSLPDAVVVVDMIGDADLNIYMEQNSDPQVTRQIWDTAASLGYEQYFIPQYKYRMLDDHIPFRQLGAPAVDLIDFDYPYWHTVEDTADKVSPRSLQVVGDTLLHWTLALAPED